MKNIIKFLMSVYLIFRKKKDKLIEPLEIRDSYNCSTSEFAKKINAMEYQMDPINGLIDNTYDPNKFYEDRDHDRDCDDFQRQWSWYGVYNGYTSKEYVICNPESIKKAFGTMHVIGTLEKENKFWLTNYDLYGPFETEEKALDYMKYFPSYKTDRVVAFYRDIKKV